MEKKTETAIIGLHRGIGVVIWGCKGDILRYIVATLCGAMISGFGPYKP